MLSIYGFQISLIPTNEKSTHTHVKKCICLLLGSNFCEPLHIWGTEGLDGTGEHYTKWNKPGEK